MKSKCSVIRANFYTSVVGGHDVVEKLEEAIAFHGRTIKQQICPRVFKKPRSSNKTKIADISISIDALRHTFQSHVSAIFLLSGDGDYIPLVKEVMRQGIQVYLGAFSSGLSLELRRTADDFIDLDQWFFVQP